MKNIAELNILKYIVISLIMILFTYYVGVVIGEAYYYYTN